MSTSAINIEIRTVDEYETVTRLIEKLQGASEDAQDPVKLEMLLEAAAVWGAKHDVPGKSRSRLVPLEQGHGGAR